MLKSLSMAQIFETYSLIDGAVPEHLLTLYVCDDETCVHSHRTIRHLPWGISWPCLIQSMAPKISMLAYRSVQYLESINAHLVMMCPPKPFYRMVTILSLPDIVCTRKFLLLPINYNVRMISILLSPLFDTGQRRFWF